MRIHSDTLTSADIYNATDAATRATGGDPARSAVRPTKFELHGSRSRARAFEILLTGSNRRGQNGNPRTPAATWDEWGWFLAHLFTVDPDAVAGPYAGADDFHRKTANVYTGSPLSAV